MYCKYCGLESDNEQVCSWCKRPLPAASAAPQAPPPPPPAGQPLPPPPPAAGLSPLGEGMPTLSGAAPGFPAEVMPLGGPAPVLPGVEVGAPTPPVPALGPDDLPAVPDLGSEEPGAEATAHREVVQVSGPTARRLPRVVLIGIPLFLVLVALVVAKGARTRTPMRPVQQWKTYTDPNQRLRVEIPAHWEAEERGRPGAASAWFFGESNLIAVSVRLDDMVGLAMDLARGRARALGVEPIRVVHDDMMQRYQALPDFALGKTGQCTIDGETAYYTDYQYTLTGFMSKRVPMRGIHFTWISADDGYVARCVCPRDDYQTFLPVVERMVATLRFKLR